MNMNTPGPWHTSDVAQGLVIYDQGGWAVADAKVFHARHALDEARANASLIAAAPELLSFIERQYIELANIHNDWSGRHTAKGQRLLCDLRDLICKATGREPQDVQDDYGNRATGEQR